MYILTIYTCHIYIISKYIMLHECIKHALYNIINIDTCMYNINGHTTIYMFVFCLYHTFIKYIYI